MVEWRHECGEMHISVVVLGRNWTYSNEDTVVCCQQYSPLLSVGQCYNSSFDLATTTSYDVTSSDCHF